jgi:hypothetical protein
MDHHIFVYTCWVMGTDFYNTLTAEELLILIRRQRGGMRSTPRFGRRTAAALEQLKAGRRDRDDFDATAS